MSSDGSTEMAAVRVDSTNMKAVRPEPVKRETLPHGMPSVPPPDAAKDPPKSERESQRKLRRATMPASVPPPDVVDMSRIPAPSKPPVMDRVLEPPARAAAPKVRAKLPSSPKLPSVRPPSLRPPPPSKRESSPAHTSSIPPAFDFDEGSIAHAFDALMSDGPLGEVGRATVDFGPVRELFAELAANHMRHVRDFMIDVKWGEAPRDWLEICVPAVTSLRRAAGRLEIPDLAESLDAFGAGLKTALASNEPGRTITGATKDALLSSYEKLVEILPAAFALDRDKSQREAVIIQSLCLSVPDVRKVTIDKLHAAGLTSLATLFDAKAEEVSQVAGIPIALAARIVERFQAYRRELANASPQDARAAERERLASLTAQLKEQHLGYEEAANGWTPDAKTKKRDLFRAREETWLAISLLLARFGEVERIQGIEKVPFAARIAQLTEYLEEAATKYRADSES